jgi:hypothetical protein
MLRCSDIKRALREAGVEIYRTRDEVVHVADRVRENLIMDAHIRVRAEQPAVLFYVRAEQTDFPGEADDALFDRARRCGDAAIERGFHEARAFVTEVPDPGNPERTLDRWFQVQFEKPVEDIASAVAEVRFALEIEKTAQH